MANSLSALAEALSKLTDRELIETIQAALKSRIEDIPLANGDFEYGRWCLARTSFGRFQNETDSEAIVEIVGAIPPAYADVDWAILCQQGRCPHCHSLVIALSKISLCPACSHEVECT